MNKVRGIITGVEMTLEEYFAKLSESFCEENKGENVTVDDIKSYCDCDYDFEASELIDGDPTYEFVEEYEKLYNEYVDKCKKHFGII